MNKEAIAKFYKTSKYFLFPIILILFALIRVDKGIGLADTTYSLGNYRFFTEGTGVWFLLTFVSNVTGYILTLLPFGSTMLGMKIYTSLLVGLMGVIGYRFFMTKMPAWLAFVSELAVVGMCWAPSVILYHYLTYFMFMMGAILLFRGLAGERPKCLFVAGLFLGINALVRFPNNGLEVLLIIPLIYYGIIQKHSMNKIFRQICLCVCGYVIGFVAVLGVMMFIYGPDALPRMINGVIGISGSASDYTFGEMLKLIFDAYWHGFKWAIYLIICSVIGIPYFVLLEGKYMRLRKIFYCLCIGFLFFVLYKWGMYNFKYYQKEAALQWGVIILLLSIGINIWMLITKRINHDWKLIGCISLVIILITPLGSNNYVWPLLNSLFLVLPVTVWMVYRFARWGRPYLDYSAKVPLFSFKAMASAGLIIFMIQAIGIGCAYIFYDGEAGESVSHQVEYNDVLKGMKTYSANADNLSSLSLYINEHGAEYEAKKLILYGNIPGISYILDKPSALNTTWSDLDSNPVEDMKEALNSVDVSNEKVRPLIIISRGLYDVPDNSIKFDLINRFIEDNGYTEDFANDGFVVFR